VVDYFGWDIDSTARWNRYGTTNTQQPAVRQVARTASGLEVAATRQRLAVFLYRSPRAREAGRAVSLLHSLRPTYVAKAVLPSGSASNFFLQRPTFTSRIEILGILPANLRYCTDINGATSRGPIICVVN
jgi:hypothetical protein